MSEKDDLVEQVFHAPEVPAMRPEGWVELGGQLFTKAEWAVVQTYAQGCSEAAVLEAQAAPYQEFSSSEVMQEMALRGEQGLDFMLGLQRDVEDAFGRLPDPSDAEQVSTYIREVILCATDELHEVLAEVHWKPWKESRGIKDVTKYREEMADVLHFILDLYLAAGLSGREIISDYMSKHYENLSRSSRVEYLES